MELPDRLEIPVTVLELARTLENAGHETWCVGGAIRDRLLGVPGGDVDLATSATPEQVQRLFRRTVPVGIRFGTVAVLDRAGAPHEVTTFRHDVETDGRHAVVRYGASLDEDLARRDFTINAIAYHPLRHEWRDPFGGGADLSANLIRAVGNAVRRFREDYLRILRGLRFAARLGFVIDDATWAAARAEAPGLAGLSAERVRDEWFKGLGTAAEPERLVSLWREVGAAAVWLPELVERALPGAGRPGDGRDPVLLTVALTGAGAPAVLRRLRASNAELARAETVVRGPAGPASPDEATVRRWLAVVGAAADDHIALHRIEHNADPAWAAVVQRIRSRGDATSRATLAVNGADLIALGVAPGPALGALLDRLLDRVLDDPSLNQRDRLLSVARELA
jgi:tRNA nucleotidyltransferase (CCA-adding enzyme)